MKVEAAPPESTQHRIDFVRDFDVKGRVLQERLNSLKVARKLARGLSSRVIYMFSSAESTPHV